LALAATEELATPASISNCATRSDPLVSTHGRWHLGWEPWNLCLHGHCLERILRIFAAAARRHPRGQGTLVLTSRPNSPPIGNRSKGASSWPSPSLPSNRNFGDNTPELCGTSELRFFNT
jgi:hypothetical protein